MISEGTVLRSILAMRTSDPTRTTTSDIPYGDLGSAYDEGLEALNRAVVFLQENAAVPHIAFLASGQLLVALTRFFAIHPDPDARNLRLLRRWVWRALLMNTQQNHAGDSRAILRRYLRSIPVARASTTLQSMLKDLPEHSSTYPPINPFRLSTPATRILLCSWWDRSPRDLRNGRRATRSDLSATMDGGNNARRAVRKIFNNLDRNPTSSANSILLPVISEAPQFVLDLLLHPGRDIPHHTWLQVIESHSITKDAYSALQQGRIENFLEIRSRAIEAQFRLFLDSQCEWGHEDTPSLTELIIEDNDDDAPA
jgi:hypothetical protein